MSCELFKRYAQEDAFIAQKCCVPVSVLRTTNIKIGDVVIVKCGVKDCICRIYPHFRPEKCVIMDDTVSCQSYSGINCYGVTKNILNFPEDFIRLKATVFENLQIKLVFRDDVDYINPNSQQYSSVASCLLKNYVVKKNAVIKFSQQKLADLWKIHSIIICETFQEANVLGRICRTSSIELIGIVSIKQANLLKQFGNVSIGGVAHAMELLEINTKVYQRILVLGPPGCGKTTLVKKLLCDFNCFTIIVDGYSDFSSEKCDSYCIQLTSISKMFPKSRSVIFIDNIDKLASSKFNDKSSLLLYFLRFLKMSDINISVIAAATHKGVINPNILNFFPAEVSLGVPSYEQRKEILEVLLRQLRFDFNICTEIAQRTPGFLAYDLSLLITSALRKKTAILKKEDCETLTMKDFEEVLSSFSSSLLKTSNWRLKVKPIYWKDIGGIKSVKERLQMCIERPLINPEVFKNVDLPIPRGVLLFGPPGCCKTTIARGLATECKANFFVASPSQIYSPFVGESEKNISELFYEARLCTPSIIFLDELDCLVARREFDNKSVGVAEKVLSALLIEMDGFGVSTVYGGNENPHKILSHCEDTATDNAHDERMNEQVVVVAATNRPDLIDAALLRPGRFDIIIYVPPPTAEERESILRTLTENVPVIDVDFKKLALLTEYFSGADLKHLHSTAGVNALRSNENAEYITEEHYLQALQSIRPSISCQQIKMYESIASKYGTFISK